MVNRARIAEFALIRLQAARLKSELPELFTYLQQRDDLLWRTIARLPDPADPESSRSVAVDTDLWPSLRRVPPGLKEIV